MKKTKLDLYLSAHKTALDNLDPVDTFTLQSNALAAFKADGFATEDYETWATLFSNARNQMLQLRKQSPPSEKEGRTTVTVAPAAKAPKATKLNAPAPAATQ